MPESRPHDAPYAPSPDGPPAADAAGGPEDSPVSGERLAMLGGVAGGSSLVAELVGLFVDDVPPRLDLIRNAVRSEDPEALQRPAHSLKGSASTLGAEGMAELCRQLEALGKTGDWPRAASVVASLETEFERVKRALAEWIAAR